MASRITFNADTAGFVQPVQKATAEVRAMKRELGEAKKASTETFRQAKLEAQAAGAGPEHLKKLTQQYARELLAVRRTQQDVARATVEDAGKQIGAEEAKAQAIAQVTRRLREQRAELDKQPLAEKSDHAEITRRQQASAILRGGGLRAAESFATTLPGFDKFSGMAFPVLGGIALGKDLGEIVSKFVEARDKARDMAMQVREGFASINAPIETSTDELRKSNAELDITIAKLEHKPANTLALTLADAALAADHLAERANSAYGQVQKLLKENRIGFFESTLFGKGNTSEAANLAEGGMRDIRDLTRDRKDAVRRYGDGSQQAQAAQAALDRREGRLRSDLAALRQKINGTEDVWVGGASGMNSTMGTMQRKTYDQAHGDQSGQREIIAGTMDVLDSQRDQDDAQKQNTAKQSQVKRLESQKQLAREGLSAAKKAAEEQRKAWESTYKGWSAGGDRTAADEAAFWNDLANTVKVGSENWIFAADKAAEAIKKVNQEQRKALDERLKFERESREQIWRATAPVLERANTSQGHDFVEQQTSLRARQDAQEDAKYRVALSGVQEQARLGNISRADAAVQMQTLHTLQYVAALKRLQEQQQSVMQDKGLSDDQRNARLNHLGAQMDELDANRAVQAYQDIANVAGQSVSGALKQANAEWVQNSRDVAHVVAGVYTSALDGVNADLSRFMQDVGSKGHYHVGRELRNSLGETARGVGGQLANTGLRYAESMVLGKFGLGQKADGSKSNPYYMIPVLPGGLSMTNAGSGAVSGDLLSRIASGFHGDGDGAASGSTAGKFVGVLGGLASVFGGFRADGGSMTSGRTYMIGERGPELFTPGASGFVTPNHAIGSRPMSQMFHIPVDARGASNPAEVEAAAHRAVMAAAPHIVRASMQAQRDERARLPNGRR